MEHLKLAKKALTGRLLEMGLSNSFTSELVNNHKKPSLEVACRIQREIGIPAHDWIDGDPLARMWEIVKASA
jgi:plasmid maintenance system antidote protein VapI